MITERDYQNILATAREQGLAEGEARGIERGRTAGLVEVARKLLASGMPEAQVAEFTGLNVEQLAALK